MIHKSEVLNESRQGLDLILYVLKARGYSGRSVELLARGQATGGFLNPFYSDTNPGLSFFEGPGSWCFKDHGNDAYSGDALTFLALHLHADLRTEFQTVLKFAREQVLNKWHETAVLESTTGTWQGEHKGAQVIVHTSDRWDYFERLLPDCNNLKGLAQELGLISVARIEWDGVEHREDTGFTFGWKLGRGLKLYRPRSSKMKFQWINAEGANRLEWLRHVGKSGKVLLTEGYKDAFVAKAFGFSAFPLDNAQSQIPPGLLQGLSEKGCLPVLCLDNDEAGTSAAEKLQQLHQLPVMRLPDEFLKHSVKDLTDLLRLNGGPELLRKLIPQVPNHRDELDEEYERIKASRLHIEQRARETIEWPRALFQFNGVDFFFPHSVNVISGHAGVHKSRVCENLIVAALAQNPSPRIGIQRNAGVQIEQVLYIDTERNQSSQIPKSFQNIQGLTEASFSATRKRVAFYSLVTAERTRRLDHVERLIKDHLQRVSSLLIILDLISDCIYDFNSPTETYRLIDRLNRIKENYEVMFFVVIHLNPGSAKERGHLGTELINKCDAALQISSQENTFTIKAVKNRSQRCPAVVHLTYDDDIQNLVTTDAPEPSSPRKPKAPRTHDVIITALPALLPINEWTAKQPIMEQLMKTTGANVRSVETKLAAIAKADSPINFQGRPMRLELARGKIRITERLAHPQTQSLP